MHMAYSLESVSWKGVLIDFGFSYTIQFIIP